MYMWVFNLMKKAIKMILFQFLLMFRRLFRGCLNGLGIYFTATGVLAMLIGFPFLISLLVFIIGIMLSVLTWYYDVLLFKLQPDNVDLTLLD